jgi:hypothetical protein
MLKIRDFLVCGLLTLLLTACGSSGGGSAGGTNNAGGAPTPVAAMYVYGIQEGVGGSSSPGNILVTSLDSSGARITDQTYTGITTSLPFAEATAKIGSNNFLYVVDPNSNVVDEFSVNGFTVTKLGSVPTGSGPESITVDKNNRFVFVGDTNNSTAGSGDIYAYLISSNGTLSQVGSGPVFNNSNPVYGVQEDTTGTYLIAACWVGSGGTGWAAKSFLVNAGGNLTMVATSAEVSISGNNIPAPQYFVDVPNTTNGDILYAGATEGAPSAHMYTVFVTSSTITLNNVTGTSGDTTEPAWVDQTGTWLFEATWNLSTGTEVLTQYKIGSSGALTAGNESPLTLQNGSGGHVGGSTNSVAGYIASSGIVIVPFGTVGSALQYNSLNGFLTNPTIVYAGTTSVNAVFLP